MAETSLATASARQVWRRNYLRDYVRRSRFEQFMGADSGSIFITARDLSQQAGNKVNLPWVGSLKAPGVYNNGVLEGNEEGLPNASYPILVQWIRNGVRIPDSESFKTEIDLMGAARDGLRKWSARNLRDWIILNGIFPAVVNSGSAGDTVSVNAPFLNILDNEGNIVRAAATTAQLNSWITQNSDRVLFGVTTANNTGTFSTSLANVDSVNDVMSVTIGTLMKQLAKETEGGVVGINPYMVEDGREYYVCFLGSRAMRDLKKDATMSQANREARAREGNGMDKNPLFQDGDLIYDGVIYREEPRITALLTKSAVFVAAGASGIPVEPIALCGAAAAGIAWSRTPDFKTDRTMDYGFRPGVAIAECRGVEKLSFFGKQNGIVTGFVSAVA